LGEITERDIIVLYELPCPVNATQTKDDNSATHVVLPVYHSVAGARMYSQDLFGIPIYLALPLEDSASTEAIYAALVERYVPWSLQPQQLYQRTIAIPESTTPSGESPQETSDGDEMEEQDVREPSELREETITNLRPHDNLFAIQIYAPLHHPLHHAYSYASGLMSDPWRGLG
jgi:hypothetical protein